LKGNFKAVLCKFSVNIRDCPPAPL
jgi:hypothetical protein